MWGKSPARRRTEVLRSVVRAPPQCCGKIAQSSGAGCAGAVGIAPSNERQIHSEQPVFSIGKIDAKDRSLVWRAQSIRYPSASTLAGGTGRLLPGGPVAAVQE